MVKWLSGDNRYGIYHSRWDLKETELGKWRGGHFKQNEKHE